MSKNQISVITIPIKVRKFEEDIINKRMELCRKIYNNMLQDRLKALRKMEHDKDYIKAVETIYAAYKSDDKALVKKIKKSEEYKAALEIQKSKLNEYGFSEFAFFTLCNKYTTPFNSNITSKSGAMSIAKPMWAAFEKYFYSQGKAVHFKAFETLNSIASDGKAGLKIVGPNNKSTGHPASPFGLSVMYGSNRAGKVITMPLNVNKKDLYMQEMICNDIKVVRLIRKKIKGGFKYYVQLTVDTAPAIKYDKETGEIKNPVNNGNVGLFIDTKKITICSKDGTKQIELIDPKQVAYEETIAEINRFLDKSRRISDPENFNEDGTIKKGVLVEGKRTKLTWHNSNNYKKAKLKKADIQRKLAEQRKIRSGEIANLILSHGNNIICNKYNFKAAQMRIKGEHKSESGKNLPKSKAGKTISYSAPAQILTILDNKLIANGCNPITRIEMDNDMKITDQSRMDKAQELYLQIAD